MTDLSAPGVSKQISRMLLEDIDNYCATVYDDGFRNHLGASLIGHECSRFLWYSFRWCFREKHDGRQQRLFNRGHREEERFVEWLEGIGAKVWFENREGLMFHPEGDSYWIQENAEDFGDGLSYLVTDDHPFYKDHIARAKIQGVKFPQFRISECEGHFGGSLDGVIELPPRYGISEPCLLEFKTNKAGSAFDKLLKNGLQVEKPQHYDQSCTYGSNSRYLFRYVVYLNICKNDDSLHVEVAELNWNRGEQLLAKAERIIFADTPPSRLSDNPTFFKCQYCAAKEICHRGAIPVKNCRSCRHATPVENARWRCDKHSDLIPKEVITEGCDFHIPITASAVNG